MGLSWYLLVSFFVLNLCLRPINAGSNLTFSFKNFGKDSNFESQIDLFGDAKVANGGTSVQISGSRPSTSGRVICKKPINLIFEEPEHMVSFSNNFVFSMSGENGDGLAFVMLPAGFPLNGFDGGSMGMLKERRIKFLGVEFDTLIDDKYRDVNSNHVGLDVGSLVSVKVSNVSSINLELESGEKLQAWIDYEASSKQLEVRLSKFGNNRPMDPLLVSSIDLSEMWKRENVTVGLTSSSGNSSQKVNLYSWSFVSRTVPNWMHSEALNPEDFAETGKEPEETKRKHCRLRIHTTLVLGAVCGALVAMAALFVWTVFRNRRAVAPEEFALQSKEFEYKKFNVVSK